MHNQGNMAHGITLLTVRPKTWPKKDPWRCCHGQFGQQTLRSYAISTKPAIEERVVGGRHLRKGLTMRDLCGKDKNVVELTCSAVSNAA